MHALTLRFDDADTITASCKAQSLATRQVEPNSGLGQSINYRLERWEPLTQFLRIPATPCAKNSGPKQSVTLHGSEVRRVAGGELHAAARSDRGILAIGHAARAAASGVEQVGGLASVRSEEWLGRGQEKLREQFVLRSKRSAKEFTPRHRAHGEIFPSRQPRQQFRFGSGAGHEGLNVEVRVEVDHWLKSTAAFADGCLPGGGLFRRELKAALQIFEGLQAVGLGGRGRTGFGLSYRASHGFLLGDAPRARQLLQDFERG